MYPSLFCPMRKTKASKKIGIVTGGGDAPGLNAVIQAIVVASQEKKWQVLGYKAGWAGALKNEYEKLTIPRIKDIQREGGTILGTSRTNPAKFAHGYEIILKNFKKVNLAGLIAIGGEDTLGVALELERRNFPVIGVPKTIDDDIGETDYTFGFDTAVNRIAESLDRLYTTARAHHRTIVVEIMGRHAGWMTLYGAVAGGAHIILIPEVPFKIEEICKKILARYKKGLTFALIACAEGIEDRELAEKAEKEKDLVRKTCLAQGLNEKIVDKVVGKPMYDAFGHPILGGKEVGKMIAEEITRRLKDRARPFMPAGIEFGARWVQLGHLQRGGSPTTFDRMLCIQFGLKAVDLIEKGQFGKMVSLRGGNIKKVSLKKALSKHKTVPPALYHRLMYFWENS